MSFFAIPDDEITKLPFWKVFTLKDALYGLVLAYVIVTQHFNNEQRIQNLENATQQIAVTLQKLDARVDTMTPRKEFDDANVSLSVRLGNIEQGQANMMTYLLNHPK